MNAFPAPIGTKSAPIDQAASAAQHDIPANYLNVMDVGNDVYAHTQAFLHAVNTGKPAKHPVTGKLVAPATVAPESVVQVLDNPVVDEVPVEAVVEPPNDVPDGDTTVAGKPDTKGKSERPYVEHYVALPRDLIKTFKECHGYTPAPKGAAKNDPVAKAIRDGNSAGKGRTAERMKVRDLYLAAAFYRMAPNDTKNTKRDDALLVIVEPSTLAAASGWSVSTLRDEFKSEHPPLPGWVRKVDGNHYNALGRVVWHFELKRVPSGGFLKMPAWWLWKEPVEGATGAAKWVKSCDWSKGSPALLVALTYVHVTDWAKGTNSRYGKTGLATVCGASPETVRAGRRAAIRHGWLTSDGSTGGKSNAEVTLCFLPAIDGEAPTAVEGDTGAPQAA